jgi:hypothetical protein
MLYGSSFLGSLILCVPPKEKEKRKRKEKHPIVHWAHIVTRRQLDLVTGLIFKARKGGH